jgi:Protein of unknown function (DUF3102)
MDELIQTTFDYSVLTPEQAQRTQDAEYRLIGRTQKTLLENGRDLLAVKSDIGHGHFTRWLQSMRLSESTAESWMSVAKNFGQIPDSRDFETRALYVLSTSQVPEAARDEAKQRAEAGEKITEEVAKQIRDAHKAQEHAEAQAQHIQQQLFLEQSQAQQTIEQLNQSIALLKKEMEDLSKPETVIQQVDTPETIARLGELENKIVLLTTQKDNLARLSAELSADLDANEARREEEARELRIQKAWADATGAFAKSTQIFLGRLPLPIDTQFFRDDDWSRLADVEALCQHTLEQTARLKEISLFIESSMPSIEASNGV